MGSIEVASRQLDLDGGARGPQGTAEVPSDTVLHLIIRMEAGLYVCRCRVVIMRHNSMHMAWRKLLVELRRHHM